MIIQVNRILWSAEFAGFQFDDIILTKTREIAFRKKERGRFTTTSINKLSLTVHQLLDELAQTNLVVNESDYQKYLASNNPNSKVSPNTKKIKPNKNKKVVLYNAQWQDVHSFAEILDELIKLSATHQFSETTIPETDPILARTSPMSAAFLVVEKQQKPIHGPHASSESEVNPHTSAIIKPNGWLIDAAREFAIRNHLPKGVTIPRAVIEEFLDSLPIHQKTTLKSARTIFANLKYKRERRRND